MKHTKECEDAQEAYEKARAVYEKVAYVKAVYEKVAYEKTADAAQAAWDKAHTKCKEVKE